MDMHHLHLYTLICGVLVLSHFIIYKLHLTLYNLLIILFIPFVLFVFNLAFTLASIFVLISTLYFYCIVPYPVFSTAAGLLKQRNFPSGGLIKLLSCFNKVNEEYASNTPLFSDLQTPRWTVCLGGAVCCLAASSQTVRRSSTGTRLMGRMFRSTPTTMTRTNWDTRTLSTREGPPCSMT